MLLDNYYSFRLQTIPMGSLKAFLPIMAGLVGTTPDALYTRQRALVDLGLLTYKPGRGPGSGSPVSADNVAALLIALMTADTLQETDKRVKEMCFAAPAGRRRLCPWTKANTLQKALGCALELTNRDNFSFASFVIYRGKGAQLSYRHGGVSYGSIFNVTGRTTASRILIDARIDAPFFRQVSAALNAEIISSN